MPCPLLLLGLTLLVGPSVAGASDGAAARSVLTDWSPEEYTAWIVGYTDAAGLAWRRSLAGVDPAASPALVQARAAALAAELAQLRQGLEGVEPYAGDARAREAALVYVDHMARGFDAGLPRLHSALAPALPGDPELQAAAQVHRALVELGAAEEADLHRALAAFGRRHGGPVAVSLQPWEALASWPSQAGSTLPGSLEVALAARRHNALVTAYQQAVACWRELTTQALEADQRRDLHARLQATLAPLRAAPPLQGRTELRDAILRYGEALELALIDASPPPELSTWLAVAQADIARALALYQDHWRFRDYQAWAQEVSG